MTNHHHILYRLLLVWLVLLNVAACSSLPDPEERRTSAETQLRRSGGWQVELVSMDGLTLYTTHRLSNPALPTRVYIEGDGQAYLTSYQASPDPTPTKPITIGLAQLDPAANVIYLARPCQYTRTQSPACTFEDWTTDRFSARQVERLDTALTYYKQRYGLGDFELVGYSGGAAMAAVLAARRQDVTGLRSVAGNLDIAAFVRLHDLSPLNQVENPAAHTELRRLPQRHLISQEDDIIPPDIYFSYAALLNSPCTASQIVENIEHSGNWQAVWLAFLQQPLPTGCTSTPGFR